MPNEGDILNVRCWAGEPQEQDRQTLLRAIAAVKKQHCIAHLRLAVSVCVTMMLFCFFQSRLSVIILFLLLLIK